MPEQESFAGQGRHYLGVLVAISLLLFLAFLWISGGNDNPLNTLARWAQAGRLWFYLAIFALPSAIGLYYWYMLREEEITVTDDFIARRSHWGNQQVAWADVREFHRKPVPFRRTQLGRITGLSQVLTRRHVFLRLPPTSYELVSGPDENGQARTFVIEPGTVDDLPWLMELISERIGPPIEDRQ